MSETLFDKIIKKEIPADIVFEDDDVLAFRDINPQAPVHVLVIPKWNCDRFQNLSKHEDAKIGVLFKKASAVANKLGLDKDGYRVVINNGRDGQQSVEYIHLHLLGGRSLTWPPG
ncbi:histidine triad nucleotide-binding protein [Oligoflexaceae bacterium]|nr:histidine triad nucleotide-binding protein [Oligoflexaceae bacterium]